MHKNHHTNADAHMLTHHRDTCLCTLLFISVREFISTHCATVLLEYELALSMEQKNKT